MRCASASISLLSSLQRGRRDVSAHVSSAAAPASAAARDAAQPHYWPQEVSHQPTLKIGEVRAILSAEFPFLAASKIRHFENIGLIFPQRTPANQRLFSLADVERLRFILVEQRDRYAHLSQIKEMLRQLDSGEVTKEHPAKMRVVQAGERQAVQPGTRLTVTELSELVGVPVNVIENYVKAGLLTQDARGRFTTQAVEITRYAQMLEEAGMDVRLLRSVHNSAHAHAVTLLNELAVERARKSPLSQERIAAATSEIAALLTHYYRALLLESIDVEMR